MKKLTHEHTRHLCPEVVETMTSHDLLPHAHRTESSVSLSVLMSEIHEVYKLSNQ